MSGSFLRVTLTVAFVWKLSQQKDQTVVRIVKGTRYYPTFLETETGLVRVCIMGLFEWTLYRLVQRHVHANRENDDGRTLSATNICGITKRQSLTP